jgi:AraC-like DNA-binding protein/HAMP domain-containing protein
MRKIPMMLQLTLILFCVMAIPMGILTWYSDMRILQNAESAIAETSLSGLNASRKLNENALNNMAQDVVRLAATKLFDRIRAFETFEEANANYNNVRTTQSVLQELYNLNHRVDGVYSTFFLLDDSDYVVSTDKGITRLDRYESLSWLDEALEGRRGIAGVWHPRRTESGVNVVSYALPLNRLSTTTRGTIVVNLKESQIAEYLRSSEPGKYGYLLMDSSGAVISHHDKKLFLTDGNELPFVRDILRQSAPEGFTFHEVDGERFIYTWSRSDRFRWWNVNIYSMDELMTKTRTLQRGINVLTLAIVVVGAVLTVLLATWLSRPLRQLVRAVRARHAPGEPNRNELAFLDAAFRRMQEEEEELYKLLKEREQDTRSLAIHNLLRGEVTKGTKELFPLPYSRAAVVSVDGYRRYVNETNPETRNYHRYVINSLCESLFPPSIHARSVYTGDGCFVVIINYGEEELEPNLENVTLALTALRDEAAALLGHSVTIGVSGEAESVDELTDKALEAMEAVKSRLIEGSGRIAFWKREADRGKKYMYPTNSERRILNFLDTGDLDSIVKELKAIQNEIRSSDYISYDNILFIYNQLAGVTIKHLRENHVGAARMFTGRANVYSTIAALDTLDELEAYLTQFFGEIIPLLARGAGEVNYGERIVRYLEEHYREEIVFEEMAKEIGISYSYMRKITYEATGKSLIEQLNHLRIEKAKKMLLESNCSIAQIAAEVGYANVQSFNRFFRKFEGMPPSGYKALKFGLPAAENQK